MTMTGLKGNWELEIETLAHYNNSLPEMFVCQKTLSPGLQVKGRAIKDFRGASYRTFLSLHKIGIRDPGSVLNSFQVNKM